MSEFYDTPPGHSTTLGEVRNWLRERADEGTKCPCCERSVKVYARKVHAKMARDLIRLYKHSGCEFTHVARTLSSDDQPVHMGDFAKLSYWGLVEEEPIIRADGGRAGWWRITPFGVEYIHGRATIPKTARVYNKRVLEIFGERVSITDALGDAFNYNELMGERFDDDGQGQFWGDE